MLRALTLLLVMLAGAARLAPPAAHGATASSCCAVDSPRVVRLMVRNHSRFSEADLGGVLDLVNRIWRPYGIDVERGTGPDAVSVVLASGRDLAPQDQSVPVLGITLFARGHALPFISLSLAAAEALAAGGDIGVIPFRAQSPERRDAILRRMLGVALAHEMGHLLLDTTRHSSTGLLKAGLSTRELAYPEPDHLKLTPAQQRQLCLCGDAAS